MSEHDLNLITDLISGRLSPSERAEALQYVASNPALQSQYETQIATASLLHDLPSPAITPEERSTLHASLRHQLHLDDAPVPAAAPAPSRWQRWWAPVTGLAAAAAVIVGAVVILPGGGSDDSFEAVSAALSETTVASQSADTSTGGGADSDGALADEAATTTAPAAAETTTTAASAEEFAGEAPPTSLPHVPDGDLDSIALAYAGDPESLARGFDSLTKNGTSDADPGIDACRAEASSADDTSVIVPVATTVVDGAEAVVLSVTPPGSEAYLVALDLTTCEELASTRP